LSNASGGLPQLTPGTVVFACFQPQDCVPFTE
jgi:hypothetical protein